MTALYITHECLSQLREMPAVDITNWRYPLQMGGKLTVHFPPPWQNQYVVLLPTSPGLASGACVTGKHKQRFTFKDDAGLTDWGGQQIRRGEVIAPIGTALLAVHLLNNSGANLSQPQGEAPRQVRKAMTAEGEIGDDYWVITPRTDYLPQTSAECRETGRKLRWHERRGHYRCLGDGRKVWIRACHAGNKDLGVIHKDYRI